MKRSGQHNYRKLFIALCVIDVLWTALIFSWSLASSDVSNKESSQVLIIIQKVLPFTTMHLVRKAAHFAEFMVLGGLLSASAGLFLTLRKTRSAGAAQQIGSAGDLLQIGVSAGIGLIIAVCDELIQLTSPGRSCQITDMLLDLCGVLVGALIVWLIFRDRQKRSLKH